MPSLVESRSVVRGLGIAIVIVMFTGVLAVLVEGDDGLPAAGARVTVDGRAMVVHLDGSIDTLSSGDVVRAGEEVRSEAGTVGLELAAGGNLEGRAGFFEAPDTRIVVGERPELVAGELLVVGDDGLGIDAAGTVVTLAGPDSAARIDRGLAVRTAVYQGGVAVDSAGQERSVAALRQISIASLGRPPGSAEPFRVDEADPWDRRFLGGAIALGTELEASSRSFTGQAPPGASTSVSLFETLIPDLEAEPAFPVLLQDAGGWPPGEVLVGAALASLGRRGPFADRWAAVFEFREEGAGWGLVALDQGLDDGAVRSTVGAALERAVTTPEVAGPPTTVSPRPPGQGGQVPPPSTTAPPGDNPPPTTTPPPTTPPPTIPPPAIPPPTTPPPTIPPIGGEPEPEPEPESGIPIIDEVLEPIGDLLGGLLD